jgi:hypothetical protein
MAGLRDLYVRPKQPENMINSTFIKADDLVNTFINKPHKTQEELEGLIKILKCYKRDDLIEKVNEIKLNVDDTINDVE